MMRLRRATALLSSLLVLQLILLGSDWPCAADASTSAGAERVAHPAGHLAADVAPPESRDSSCNRDDAAEPCGGSGTSSDCMAVMACGPTVIGAAAAMADATTRSSSARIDSSSLAPATRATAPESPPPRA